MWSLIVTALLLGGGTAVYWMQSYAETDSAAAGGHKATPAAAVVSTSSPAAPTVDATKESSHVGAPEQSPEASRPGPAQAAITLPPSAGRKPAQQGRQPTHIKGKSSQRRAKTPSAPSETNEVDPYDVGF
jgi:hypothetical protein